MIMVEYEGVEVITVTPLSVHRTASSLVAVDESVFPCGAPTAHSHTSMSIRDGQWYPRAHKYALGVFAYNANLQQNSKNISVVSGTPVRMKAGRRVENDLPCSTSLQYQPTPAT